MAEKKKVTPKTKSNKKWVLLFWVFLLLPPLLLVFLVFLASISDLPTFEQLENPKLSQATEVYSSDHQLLGKYYSVNRNNVKYEDISPTLINALVATEDERYYDHSGIDFRSLPRVVKGVLTGNSAAGGGSTITQQLSKLLFHERATNKIERVFQKFQEWVISVRLERQYTKNEILTMYLNQFDFIHNAVGIKSASNIYFDTSPDSLNIQEAATLVGMLKNPALYNPLRRLEMTQERRNVVLFQMKRNELLSEAEYDSLKALPLELHFTMQTHDEGPAPYFRAELKKELKSILNQKDSVSGVYFYSKGNNEPYDIYNDGLKVYTTINSRMQQYAEAAVEKYIGEELQGLFSKHVAKNKLAPFSNDLEMNDVKRIIDRAIKRTDRYRLLKQHFDGEIPDDSLKLAFNTPTNMRIFSWQGEIDTLMSPLDSIFYYKSFLQSGMISIDPHTGFVKAWVGGINYKHFKYDHVKQGKRQVGSTFKPFVYATAIRSGFSPCYEIPKVPTTFEAGRFGLTEDYTPTDPDGRYGYMASLKYGLANSINTMTAWVMYQFGPEAVVKLAHNMGIKSRLDAVPSLSYGVTDLSLYELTGALGTLANKGVHIEPIIISRIEDKNGNVIYSARPEMNEAMDEQTAYVMISLMQGTVDGVYNAYADAHPDMGARTGTAMRLKMDLPSRDYDGIPREYAVACKTGTTQNQSDGWFIGITPDLITGVWVGAEDRSVRFNSLNLGSGTNMALPIWGYYMKDVYADSTIVIEKERFEPPENGLSIEIDCDKYSQISKDLNSDNGGGLNFE
jgi:penicillin-binding protein 1A